MLKQNEATSNSFIIPNIDHGSVHSPKIFGDKGPLSDATVSEAGNRALGKTSLNPMLPKSNFLDKKIFLSLVLNT